MHISGVWTSKDIYKGPFLNRCMTEKLKARSTMLFIAALVLVAILSLAAMVKAQSITASFGNIGKLLSAYGGGLK